MPFKSKAQARYMFAKHPKIAKEFAAHTSSMKKLPEKKGTKGNKARLNTAAEKMLFNNRYSK